MAPKRAAMVLAVVLVSCCLPAAASEEVVAGGEQPSTVVGLLAVACDAQPGEEDAGWAGAEGFVADQPLLLSDCVDNCYRVYTRCLSGCHFDAACETQCDKNLDACVANC